MNINEDKIEEFMEKHGVRGFLRIYFAEFFYRNLMDSIKSGKEQGDIELDTGIQYHVAEELSGSKIKDRKDKIRRECGEKADELISLLENDEDFDELFEGNFEILEEEKTQKKINTHIMELAEKIGEEDEP